MIKVILPQNNRNDFSIITDAVLKDVCKRLYKTTSFKKEYEDRAIGRYFKVINEKTKEIYFIVFCNPTNNSRNAHLLQFIPPAYRDYYVCYSNNKHLAIYLINPDGNDRTPYIKLFYRCFKNLGINIINFDQVGISNITSFTNYEEFRIERNNNRDRNTGNESTYFEENENDITIYGKTDGTNVNESFILALALAQIMKKHIDDEDKKPIYFYPVKEDLKEDYKAILQANGVKVEEKIETLPDGSAKPETEKLDSIRNTKIYHYNLLQKFGEKRCYLCHCDIEHTVIGSHIERVTDIKNNPAYSEKEKLSRAVDGENGLWLCATHDKMFEFGIIYFDKRLLKIGKYVLDPKQKDYINKSIFDLRKVYSNDLASNVFKIDPKDFTAKMEEYIDIHKARVA